MLKVANIIEDGRIAGPQVRMTNVAAKLMGHIKTTLVFPITNSRALQERCSELDVDFKTLPLTRLTKERRILLRYIFFSWWEVIVLMRYLRRERYDLVHVSGGSWQYKGLIAARLCGIPVIWHLNDTDMPRSVRTVFSVLSRLSSGFIFASYKSRAYYGALASNAMPQAVIPAPVDLERFETENLVEPSSKDRQLLKKLDGKIVVGTVSNISPVKDIGTFVDMAALCSAGRGDMEFIVVGPVYSNQSEYFEKIRYRSDKAGLTNIHFVGGRQDVRPLLSRFDIYTCTSTAESSPVSVWEAMAMSKPIVSTDVGDVPLHVKEKFNGAISPVGDAACLARSVLALAGDAELRHRFGTASRREACSAFELDDVAQRTLDLYIKVSSRYDSVKT
ncbi:glycosyltransferase [Psychromarinibacter sp. C21-152]|uniref:Glycosyltransferase n=1 Tax=Psychromarinibacter sediminicola TaxID=3033385 RepID=A0AAE3NZ91_9RHOB|nr:glycosyltransferase [Psychromarinibacter sediminicola]MDF0603615.1 glycosyltransferase [Psychromarinibacter sediminicola]